MFKSILLNFILNDNWKLENFKLILIFQFFFNGVLKPKHHHSYFKFNLGKKLSNGGPKKVLFLSYKILQ